MSPQNYVCCPKCGQDDPLVGWKGPKYQVIPADMDGPPRAIEWLEWTCNTCGYERREATRDAKDELPTTESLFETWRAKWARMYRS